ncbi:MAG TPA: hypothetical protein VGI12_21285 [Vicinamibacterales bacterium]
MLRACVDGIRRVVSAPVLLVCTAAAALLTPLHPTVASRRILFEFVLIGSFVAGGAIDRYARARPTRATGFFGACGRHLGGMLRLAALEALLYLAADNLPQARVAQAVVVIVNLLFVYARVRLVVEDRRSAIGAVLAAGRFVRRNVAAAVGVYGVWAAAALATASVLRGAAPIVVLPMLASAAVLFQSRLAHVAYTAAPPVEWPESPAAEAIANRR